MMTHYPPVHRHCSQRLWLLAVCAMNYSLEQQRLIRLPQLNEISIIHCYHCRCPVMEQCLYWRVESKQCWSQWCITLNWNLETAFSISEFLYSSKIIHSNVCAVRDLLGGASFVSLAGQHTFFDNSTITRLLCVNISVYIFHIEPI